ncbi:hypothetical protein D3C71_1761660 [compost metagenome]
MFDVVALQHVDIVDAEAGAAFVETAEGRIAREIPVLVAIAADLGHQHESVAWCFLQRGAQGRLGARHAIIGRDVDQIDPGSQGCGDDVVGLRLRDVLIDSAQ